MFKNAQTKSMVGGLSQLDNKQIKDQLQSVQDKLERGYYNSVMIRQLKAQKTKEAGAKVPDIEGLRKAQEDKTYG